MIQNPPQKPDILPRIRPWLSVPHRDMVVEVVRRIGPATVDAIGTELTNWRRGNWATTSRGDFHRYENQASKRLLNLCLGLVDAGVLKIELRNGEITYCISMQ